MEINEKTMKKAKLYAKVGILAAMIGGATYATFRHFTSHFTVTVGDSLNETFGPYYTYLPPERMLVSVFNEVMFRETDQAEVDAWAARIGRDGMFSAVHALINDYEPFVKQMFTKYVQRLPSDTEYKIWKGAYLRDGQHKAGVAIRRYLGERHIKDKYTVTLYGFPTKVYDMAYTNAMSTKDFVVESYQVVYGRPPTTFEMDFARGHMWDLPHKTIFMDIATSSRYYVTLLYRKFLPTRKFPVPGVVQERWKGIFRQIREAGETEIYKAVYKRFVGTECMVLLYGRDQFRGQPAILGTKAGTKGGRSVIYELAGHLKSVRIPHEMFEYFRLYDEGLKLIFSSTGGDYPSLPPSVALHAKTISWNRKAL